MIERDALQSAGNFLDRDRGHVRALQADHAIVLAGSQQLGGVGPEARGEDAIVSGRRAPSLQIAEHGHPRFDAQSLADGASESIVYLR